MAGPLTALPALREDLQIVRSGHFHASAPAWIMRDPLTEKFFKISFELYQLLSLWNRCATSEALQSSVSRAYSREVAEQEIPAALAMLDRNRLLAQPAVGGWRALFAQSRSKLPLRTRFIHSYLSFRIPLFDPSRFIRWTWPAASLIFTRGFAIAVLFIVVTGIYFTSRQWDVFVASFPYFFTLEGAALAVCAILVSKSLHELGHAYTAHYFGCRVSSIGIMLMMLTPMLYANVTDSWRLPSRRQRVLIDLAGVMAELALGAVALFLWAFLPDGPWRSVAFTLATASIAASLVINLNPLMRFDGYYILADLWGVENLSERAFRHMRWQLRETLFGLGQSSPENPESVSHPALLFYAVLTCLYRLVLFTGIAILIYNYLFKAAGIILFFAEIGILIAAPVFKELRQWWTMRQEIISRKRTWLTMSILGVCAALAVTPISTSVRAPAMLMPENLARIFPPEAAQISEIRFRQGQTVQEGETLAVLSSAALTQEKRLTETRLTLTRTRLARIGSDSQDLAQSAVTRREQGELEAKLDGIRSREAQLIVKAPFGGTVTDTAWPLSRGQWIQRGERLLTLVGGGHVSASGYVSANDISRLPPGAEGRFIPDDWTHGARSAALSGMSVAPAESIELPELVSDNGGRIAAARQQSGGQAPIGAQFAVTAQLSGPVPAQTERGILTFKGRPESLAARIWRQVLRVLVRESGA